MDKDMLRQFYRRYADEIYLYLYSLCKSRETAEDLMQEVFLKALLSLPDQNENLRAWLYKVARNACFNELRNRKRELQSEHIEDISASARESLQENSSDNLVDELIRSEQRRFLYEAMLKLPDRQREILELFYFSELSIKEIAEIMRLTSQNVRVLAYRAKKKLREYMEVKGYEL
jgi:RNA polymerase sigma factor (sigma-70 family)